ncbi:Cytochrome c551 peroxidase precursor [Grimontia hollisae]|uniref:Cytochrome c551 peroxidase n=1 Tax=Grimontia hollisae TaxID=673 RepID=A0A377HPA5_GRIHO|nr:Cytochrome c551 peroxidase precursor [Grimontia hollisae]
MLSVGLLIYLGSVYKVNQDDTQLVQKNLAQFSSLDPSTLDYQAMKVLADQGCAYCHSPNSEMPFYSQVPIAKQLMEADVRTAMRYFDMTNFLDDVKRGGPISEVALARIEKVLNDDSMPLSLYLTMHWAALLQWIRTKRAEQHRQSPVSDERKSDVLQPIYTMFETDADKVTLGKVLYHDTRLSADNSISYASCHSLTTGGVDRRVSSVGIHNQIGGINALTVFNAEYQTAILGWASRQLARAGWWSSI